MPRQFAMRASHPNAGIAAGSFLKTTDNAVIKRYSDALAFLKAGPAAKRPGSGTVLNLQSRILASNVLVHVLEGPLSSPKKIAIQLYNTNIIIYHRPTDTEEVFEADNGGFNTPTTSTRCTQFGPRGYHFSHHNKKLLANAHETGPGVLIPVWTHNSVADLAAHKGLEASQFTGPDAGFDLKADDSNKGLEGVFDLLRKNDPKWLANRVEEMNPSAGKAPYIRVSEHTGKPTFDDRPYWLSPKQVEEKNKFDKDFHAKWVPFVEQK